jgi:DNA gyrase/topoisomerase IV subunit A
MSARINILKRRKQLALHNGHFASAETLSTQIKELEILLEKSQEEQDRIDDAASTIDILDEEKKNLSVLEKELVDLEKTFGNRLVCVIPMERYLTVYVGSELRTVLAGLKEELEKSLLDLQQQPDSSNDNILKVLVEYELAFVKSKLEHDQQELSSYF